VSNIIKSLPFHLQVYQIVRESILTGKLGNGERLLEAKLSNELGVSRSPIREALRMLEQDGLVITSEIGTIVNPMEIQEVEEIYQCRIATEPYAAYLAAQRLTSEDASELVDLINQVEEAYDRKKYELVVELNTAFHDLIVKLSNNGRLVEIVDRLRSLSILARNEELLIYLRPKDYLVEHHEIINALTEKNPENAEKALRKHIENDWKYYLGQSKLPKKDLCKK